MTKTTRKHVDTVSEKLASPEFNTTIKYIYVLKIIKEMKEGKITIKE